jgi:hypothetical protein
VNREVLTGGVPYDGFTPLQAAIGVVQRLDSAFFTWLFGHVDSLSNTFLLSLLLCEGFSRFCTLHNSFVKTEIER